MHAATRLQVARGGLRPGSAVRDMLEVRMRPILPRKRDALNCGLAAHCACLPNQELMMPPTLFSPSARSKAWRTLRRPQG